jgi:prophage regulatory protein
MEQTPSPVAVEFLTDRDLSKRYRVSRATIWRWVRAGSLPAPLRLSPACTRWRSGDLNDFEAKRAEAVA